MKKLMIAAAIVCAAAISQAATANWATPMTVFEGQSDTDMNTYDVKWAIVEAATQDAFGSVSFDSGVLTGATAFDSGTTVGLGLGYPQDGVLSGATAGNWYALLIHYGDDVNKWGISTAVQAATNPTEASGEVLYDIAFANGIAFETDAMIANRADAVPEPTSGLLLLLGVAGLALRRRRA